MSHLLVSRLRVVGVSLLLACVLGSACSDDSGQTPPADAAVAQLDTTPPATALHVAAVQYSEGNHSYVAGCDDDFCALEHFAREAAGKGAVIIATPEAALDQTSSEEAPAVGDTPATDSRWADGSFLKRFSKLSDELGVTLIFNLVTKDGGKLYNTNIAVDSGGKVVARHFKFQLFGGETGYFDVGTSIEESFFQTKAGLAGLMICADAQCIVTKLNESPDCTKHAIAMIKSYFEKKPKLIFFSSFWTVGTGIWGALAVQKQVSMDGAVWLIAANNTEGPGKGGAIFEPGGEEVSKHVSDQPGIIYAEIPFEK